MLGEVLVDVGCVDTGLSAGDASLSGFCSHFCCADSDGSTYEALGLQETSLRMRQEVYAKKSKLFGEEHLETLGAANNYASTLNGLQRFDEAKSLLRKTIPVARRVLGESNELTLAMKLGYANALYMDDGATLDHLREAVTTLEDVVPIARRVLGGTHPLTTCFEGALRDAQAALRARDTE